MYVSSSYGYFAEGYLHGDDREYAESIIADGDVVAVHGYSSGQAQRVGGDVILLYQSPNSTGGWYTGDYVTLEPEPEKKDGE